VHHPEDSAFAVGVAFLVAALHHPAGRLGARLYGGVVAFIAAIGIAVAGRHVWLQHLPPEKRPACGPALDYLLSAFGPIEGLSRVLRGSGECGAVDWTLLSSAFRSGHSPRSWRSRSGLFFSRCGTRRHSGWSR